MRKIFRLVFVLVAVAALTACGGTPTAVDSTPTLTPTALTPTATAALAQYVIPIDWFASQGLDYSDGVTVAYTCETGARAWQGPLAFSIVPTESKIEVVEVDCVQYIPGETIPQDVLDRMQGVGTIWFLLPIEGTESQMGDCPCVGEDC